MCFGSKVNPEVGHGAQSHDHPRPHPLDSDEQNLTKKPVKKSSGSGWLANTPHGRSKAIQKNLTEQQKSGARPT
ncbi:uncharacterized protein BP5553_06300 [Venustampulla echinocandica]|uniref:Uncharacterized protein n=1 Tax=Venustampulla echinocandica TaxID=2656787 RepID=A0A370TJH9_9HELO|nr:uncharacterized protein BP5553_06300 [Venustampulla echinocandica]RDL35688.1 hypothetical protein BP5553_06300 [Venustampulla echinocandica]